MTETAKLKKLSRDEIRSAILATHKPKNVPLNIFGVDIELRQPKIGDVMNAQQDEDRQRGIIDIMIKQAYVPETDELVFDEADRAQLLELPMGADIMKVVKALETLTDVNFLDKKPG